MRRVLAAVAVAGAAALGLGACALPEGIDGKITNGWPALPGPVGHVPEAGTCHLDYIDVVTSSRYKPVPCTRPHAVETAHVGTFSGAAADRLTPPPAGSSEMREAYHECEEAVAEYLGADFRHGRLWLGVVLPSEAAWGGGARWFRCDLTSWTGDGDPDRRESLRDALAEGSDLRLGCYTVAAAAGGDVDEMEQVDCDDEHQAEFVGVWRAPDVPYLAADDDDAAARVHRGCRSEVADFVDLPDDGNLIYRTGTIADWMEESDWAAGNRGFRCYLYLPDRTLTRSLRGAGPDGLPVQ